MHALANKQPGTKQLCKPDFSPYTKLDKYTYIFQTNIFPKSRVLQTG